MFFLSYPFQANYLRDLILRNPFNLEFTEELCGQLSFDIKEKVLRKLVLSGIGNQILGLRFTNH